MAAVVRPGRSARVCLPETPWTEADAHGKTWRGFGNSASEIGASCAAHTASTPHRNGGMTGPTRLFRRLARAMAVVGLAAWALGSLWALTFGTPDMFHRFGALGVAAAVLFFTDRLLKIELDRQKAIERLLHEYGIELEVIRSGTPPSEMPPDGYVADYLVEEAELRRLRARSDRFQAANVGLLTFSTLQWGFGDLLVTPFLPDGGA
ncbi:MAG: hypothetical protein GVY27_12280 [Deinococcus-Thermus bacterium]|nr:hypothetical protein [Deinococcota bacterium]